MARNQHKLDFVQHAAGSDTEECIEWPHEKYKNGYGRLFVKGKFLLAHRVVLETASGETGAIACHSCNNPSCVNPKHLRWDTQAGNLADRHANGTHPAGAKNPRAKLTQEQVNAIRADNRTRREIAAEYGVSISTITAVKLYNNWKG